MGSSRLFILLAVCFLGIAWLVFFGKEKRDSADRSTESKPAISGEGKPTPVSDELSRMPLSVSTAEPRHDGGSKTDGLLLGLNDERGTIQQDLTLVENLLFSFHSVFNEFPYGDNAELMAAFSGGNARKIAFVIPETVPLDSEGRLIDRWGTPFYFHRLSGAEIEVRSAGPDGVHWTVDDFSSVESSVRSSQDLDNAHD